MESKDIKHIWKVNSEGLPLRMMYMLMVVHELEEGEIYLIDLAKLMKMTVGDINRYMNRGNVLEYFEKINKHVTRTPSSKNSQIIG